MNKNYTITCFEYEAEQPLKKIANYSHKPTKEDVFSFVVKMFNNNINGTLTQEDLDFIAYNLIKFGVVRFDEQYCFSLVENDTDHNYNGWNEVWIYNSLDMEAENPKYASAVSTFGTKEEAFECMENNLTEDIEGGLVSEDGYGGEKTDDSWEATSSDGRFYHRVFKSYFHIKD